MSTSTEFMDGLNATAERRFYPRVTPPTPIYVAFGPSNLGVLHNVSENGLQVSTPDELPVNSVFRVSLALNGAPRTIGVTVRTIWTNDASKRSGIQLLDLADEDRQQIRKWIVFELNRNENPNARQLAKNGERPSLSRKPMDANPADLPAVPGQQGPRQQGLGSAPQSQESAASTNEWAASSSAAALPNLWDELPPPAPATPVSTPNAEPEPVSQASGHAHFAAPPPVEAQPDAVSDAELPKIANPFDDPDPSAQFTSPFPKVPLPIHSEFEYSTPPPQIRHRKNLSSQLRTRPLIVWAAALALLCFGANALVRYKIKRNAQRFASESVSTTAAKQSDGASASPDNSDSSSGTSPVTDSPSSNNSGADTASQDQPSSTASAPATTAQNDRQPVANPTPSRSAAKDPEMAQPAPRRESSLDAGGNRAYVATAPPSSGGSDQIARSSQPAAIPRAWTAPAPSASSSTASPSSAPQSPAVTSASNNIPAQSAPAPVAAQTQPVPPPSSVQTPSANNSSSSVSASNSQGTNPPARTQSPAPSNSQSSTYASNANTTPSRPQSPIYNANAPAQRSAIIASINSVHSSGIFDSKDDTTATAAPPPASRGNANAPVATRPVANASVVAADVPQDRDIEIPAPKGFNASWVDLPGEHVVRSPAGTVHIHRLVRVGGERIPGQRWLWRGKLNVTVGDVINRIDPSVVQASGTTGGSLTVVASIDKDGYVTDLKPLYGNFALLPSVSRTVRNWHYEPTYLDSKRAETQAQIEFDLRPTSASSSTTRTTRP